MRRLDRGQLILDRPKPNKSATRGNKPCSNLAESVFVKDYCQFSFIFGSLSA